MRFLNGCSSSIDAAVYQGKVRQSHPMAGVLRLPDDPPQHMGKAPVFLILDILTSSVYKPALTHDLPDRAGFVLCRERRRRHTQLMNKGSTAAMRQLPYISHH
jgi:hypothetical protein